MTGVTRGDPGIGVKAGFIFFAGVCGAGLGDGLALGSIIFGIATQLAWKLLV